MANPHDRVKETCASFSSTTSPITLTGAATGCQPFSKVVANGAVVNYAIVDTPNAQWEIGQGVFTLAGTTLTRTTIFDSSNRASDTAPGTIVNFTAGIKDVFITDPAVATYLTPTPVKTSAYTCAPSELVRLNSSGGAFTVTLPASPADGDKVGFFDITNSCGTNAVLVAGNGKNVEGDATGLSINMLGAHFILLYNSSTTNWKIEQTPILTTSMIITSGSVADGDITVFNGTTGLSLKKAVSGTHLKTVNGTTIIGSGDIVIPSSDSFARVSAALVAFPGIIL